MKKVYIIGTGGLAAELTQYIFDNNKIKNEIIIEGYLDIDKVNYKKYKYEAPYLGNEKIFSFPKGSIVYIAIGDNLIRNKVVESLKDKDIVYENFIHHTCIIANDIKIGIGNMLCPNTIIAPNTIIGNHNLVNFHSSIAHDCVIGDANVLSPNVQIMGYCQIGNNNFFGVSSGIIPSVSINNNNKIQAGVIVDKKIDDNSFFFTTTKTKKMIIYS